MKRFLLGMAVVVLGLGFLVPVRADSDSGADDAEGGFLLVRSQDEELGSVRELQGGRRPAGRHTTRDGHAFLPKHKIAALPNGTYHFHTHRHPQYGEHRVHAQIRNGKIAKLYSLNRRGQKIVARRSYQGPARRSAGAAVPDAPGVSEDLAAGAPAGTVFFIFQLDLGGGARLTFLVIHFDAESVEDPDPSGVGQDEPPDGPELASR
jgi:hypothetical protein